jgi:lipopolysaccharide heptosyltransferase II
MNTPLTPPTRIAIAQLAFIGDMVFATPLLAEIYERWPHAAMLVIGRPAALEILEDHPAKPTLLPYDKDRNDRGIVGLCRVGMRLRAFQPNLFVGVSRSARTMLLARLSGAAVRSGFCGPCRRLAYTHVTPRNDALLTLPLRPLQLLHPYGINPAPRPLHVTVEEAKRREGARQLLEAGWKHEPLIAIAPGAHYATKRWPEHHVGALLDLIAKRTDWRIALYGGPNENELIARLLADRSRVLDRRDVGIRGLAAELPHASLFIGADSGPTHLARALGLPALVLHGPTDPGPVGDGRPYHALSLQLPCQPCSTSGDTVCPLGHHQCLQDLSPELVFQEAIRRLNRN